MDFEEDLYFRVVPVKDEAHRQLIEEQAEQGQIVKNIIEDQNKEIQALGRPMEIETNMQNHLVTIMMPLPTDVQLTNKMLENLAIFIQHSDGTKEVLPGKMGFCPFTAKNFGVRPPCNQILYLCKKIAPNYPFLNV